LNEDAIAVLDEQRGKHAHLSSANIGLARFSRSLGEQTHNHASKGTHAYIMPWLLH